MVSSSCANSPSAYASYDVLVHQLADLLAASSRQTLTDLPLPFASSYHLIAILIAKDGDLPTEDFHLISSCPCWAYTRRLRAGTKSLACARTSQIITKPFVPLNATLYRSQSFNLLRAFLYTSLLSRLPTATATTVILCCSTW